MKSIKAAILAVPFAVLPLLLLLILPASSQQVEPDTQILTTMGRCAEGCYACHNSNLQCEIIIGSGGGPR